jgi:hypothetical protein
MGKSIVGRRSGFTDSRIAEGCGPNYSCYNPNSPVCNGHGDAGECKRASRGVSPGVEVTEVYAINVGGVVQNG